MQSTERVAWWCRFARPRPGLQGKTILLAAVGFIAIFGFAAFEGISTHLSATRRMLDERVLLAQAAAYHIGEHLDEATEFLQDLAGLASASGRDPRLVFGKNDVGNAFSGGLTVLDPEGRVLHAEPAAAAAPLQDLSGQSNILTARHTGKVAISGVLTSPSTQHPVISLAAPIVDSDGQINGFVEGKIDLINTPIEWLLLSASLVHAGYTQLVDGNGMIVAHSDPSRRFQRVDDPEFLSQLIAGGEPSVGVYTMTQPDGTSGRKVVAFAPIPAAHWALTVEQEEADVLAGVYQLRDRVFAVGGVALLATLILTWAVSHRVVSPILALREATRKMAAGNLDDIVPAGGPDEIGELAQDFDQMRQNLQASRTEIERLYQKSLADNERLQKFDQLKTQLMATVSHDCKDPLALISCLAELMLDRRPDDCTYRQYLQLIQSEVGRLAEMLNYVLEFSRIQPEGKALRQDPVKLCEIVQYCLATYRPELEKGAEHEFELDIAQGLPPVRGDRERLVQVVMNLVRNAIKYSPSGGQVAIGLRLLEDAREVLLTVEDQGIGIPHDAMPHLFEPFFRVQNDSTAGIPGTGLGLMICRHIVEAHGGRIWVESETGRGSTFYVALPSLN